MIRTHAVRGEVELLAEAAAKVDEVQQAAGLASASLERSGAFGNLRKLISSASVPNLSGSALAGPVFFRSAGVASCRKTSIAASLICGIDERVGQMSEPDRTLTCLAALATASQETRMKASRLMARRVAENGGLTHKPPPTHVSSVSRDNQR